MATESVLTQLEALPVEDHEDQCCSVCLRHHTQLDEATQEGSKLELMTCPIVNTCGVAIALCTSHYTATHSQHVGLPRHTSTSHARTPHTDTINILGGHDTYQHHTPHTINILGGHETHQHHTRTHIFLLLHSRKKYGVSSTEAPHKSSGKIPFSRTAAFYKH